MMGVVAQEGKTKAHGESRRQRIHGSAIASELEVQFLDDGKQY